jgi:hypothetical protein
MKKMPTDMAPSPIAFLRALPSGEEARDAFPGIWNVPRPRPWRWDWNIGVSAALIIFFAGLLNWDLSHSKYYFAPTGRVSLLIQGAGMAVAVVFFFLPALSKQGLLRNGDVAVGRVVHQELMQQSGSVRSVIFYAFEDSSKHGFIGQRFAHWDVVEGAPIVVYYDPSDPTKNIALKE